MFTPSALPALHLSADYYRIDVHDAIDSLSDADPDYIPDRIDAPDQNIGAIKTSGIDLGVTYRHTLGPLDTVRLNWQSTVLLGYEVEETPAPASSKRPARSPTLPRPAVSPAGAAC